jgi:hypothetical protein
MMVNDLETQTIIMNAFTEQYGAAFKTLEKIIDVCPENLWSDELVGPQIYKVLYHTLFFIDFYLSLTKEARDNFTPKFEQAENFRTSKKNFHPKEWKSAISPEEMREYIKDLREKAQNGFKSLKIENLISDPIFEWHGSSICSSLMYNLRHMMLHIGALQARLRISGVEERFWVSQSPLLE